MGLTDALNCLVPNDERDCREHLSSMDGALYEMKNIYQERVPYAIQEMVGGLCLTWDETFLALMRYAMSTDCMDQMTSQEREIWRYWVEFENAHSTAATDEQCGGHAVGATDKREVEIDDIIYPFASYPVRFEDKPSKFMVYFDELEDKFKLTVTPAIPDFPKFCIDEVASEPLADVPKAYVYDDLDGQFYKIHECLPYNDCGCGNDVIVESNDCHNPGDAPSDPDAIYDDLYKTGCGTGFCSSTIKK